MMIDEFGLDPREDDVHVLVHDLVELMLSQSTVENCRLCYDTRAAHNVIACSVFGTTYQEREALSRLVHSQLIRWFNRSHIQRVHGFRIENKHSLVLECYICKS